MTALPLAVKDMRARNGLRLRPLALLAALHALFLFAATARAEEPVKGTVAVYTDGGYARLAFRLDDEVGASVEVSGAIMVIRFKKPVDVAVDRLNAGAPDYISAARRDPDGTAIRIALARKIKVSTIPAAERYYVDLLPDTWKGILPGLPQEVVDELAQRARQAERQLHKQRLSEKQKQPPLIKVRVARQPTFIRYVFEMPASANVVPEQKDGRLTLNFDQQIKWDLADVQATLPATLQSVDNEVDFDSAAVTFLFKGAPAVRSFREERSIVVDVPTGAADAQADSAIRQIGATDAALAIAAPETVPAKDVPAAPVKAVVKQAPAPATEAPAPAAASPAVPSPPLHPAKDAPALLAPPAMPAAVKPGAPAAPVAAEPARPSADAKAAVAVALHRSGETLRLEFPFALPTPAAVFTRADMLWLVFDSEARIDLAALASEQAQGIRKATVERSDDGGAVVRIKLTRPRLVSLDSDGPIWGVTIADSVTLPSRALAIARTVLDKNRAGIAIPFEQASTIHRLRDPEVGDRLIVITALAPARGFLKAQHFVELRALASTQGVAVQPIADDVTAQIDAHTITIARPGGLSLSSSALGAQPAGASFRSVTFDPQTWGFDRQAPFVARQSELIRIAAAAPESKRRQARFNLARFYLARDMAAEAKAVLDVALGDGRGDDVTGSVLRAVADVMLARPEEALKELSAPQIGSQQDAPVWRAIAYARQGQWAEARAGLKNLDDAIGALPVEIQRLAMQEALRAAIEVRDFSAATRLLNEFETIGVPSELKPSIDVLAGRLDEGLGRKDDALANYRSAVASPDRRAAAQGRLHEIELMFANGEMPRKDMIAALETLTTVWRGDETETEGLKLLAHFYTEDSRYRDAFHTMRTALLAHPNSDWTRKIQDEAAITFDSLFLAGKGDALPPVEALGLFFDFRELTPVGRRGDEMIRRLADRLVAVDLLDQAAELLKHQVDHRLQGAARAQVATRLATIYLMNRKPDRALATLQSTRMSELAGELRDHRLLLEARALSDLGRHDVALELIVNIKGREAARLRADILWAAKRWAQAAEQIELLYGARWRDFKPLDESERADILRAAIGYALGDETLGAARLREKYAAKFAEGPDRRAFGVVSAPIGADSAEFQDLAKRVAGADTLSAFLRDMRRRYPDSSPVGAGADAGAAPAEVSDKSVMNTPMPAVAPSSPLPPKAPAGVPLKPDPAPTGSVPRLPRAGAGVLRPG